MAPGKLHPLWYTPYLPVFFFVSAIMGGLTMVIFESMMSHRIFGHQVTNEDHTKLHNITLGLGKGAAAVMFTYFCLKWVGVAHDHHWALLSTPMGQWFLVEVLAFVLAPCIVLFYGTRTSDVKLIRFGAIWAILGLLLNRINVSMIALNWDKADRYVPHWKEIMITITVITLGLLTFRFIVNRMPILYRHPAFSDEPEH